MNIPEQVYEENRRRNRRTNWAIFILCAVFLLSISLWFVSSTNSVFTCQRTSLNNMAHDLHLAISGDKNAKDYHEGPQTC